MFACVSNWEDHNSFFPFSSAPKDLQVTKRWETDPGSSQALSDYPAGKVSLELLSSKRAQRDFPQPSLSWIELRLSNRDGATHNMSQRIQRGKGFTGEGEGGLCCDGILSVHADHCLLFGGLAEWTRQKKRADKP